MDGLKRSSIQAFRGIKNMELVGRPIAHTQRSRKLLNHLAVALCPTSRRKKKNPKLVYVSTI
uniref:Uncharacterized protein n=1 Tax=Anguilla anguilla TaxID=7936 RepID=A0A0E9WDJ4_ANGAN